MTTIICPVCSNETERCGDVTVQCLGKVDGKRHEAARMVVKERAVPMTAETRAFFAREEITLAVARRRATHTDARFWFEPGWSCGYSKSANLYWQDGYGPEWTTTAENCDDHYARALRSGRAYLPEQTLGGSADPAKLHGETTRAAEQPSTARPVCALCPQELGGQEFRQPVDGLWQLVCGDCMAVAEKFGDHLGPLDRLEQQPEDEGDVGPWSCEDAEYVL